MVDHNKVLEKNTDSVDVDEVSDLDKEVSDSVINYSKFIDRDLHVGDFDLAFKIVKVRYPIQLNITESKEKKSVYVYQYGSMDFAFEENDLVKGICSLHQSFIPPKCPKKIVNVNVVKFIAIQSM